MFVLDSHCDVPSQLLRGRDLSKDNVRGHVDFPKLRRGGVDASFFALYTPAWFSPDRATRYALEMLAAVNDALASNPGEAVLTRTPAEALKNKEKGLISIFLGMENGSPIQKSLSLLRLFKSLGVSYMTLTHNKYNEIGDSAAGIAKWGGLSPFGKEVVAEMNRIGMMIDIAHVSDRTFFDCIALSKKPIVSTHSSCRALCRHRRNLSDEMLRALSDKGGVCQINFYPLFLSDRFASSLDASGLDPIADKVENQWQADPLNPKKCFKWYAVQDSLAALDFRPSVKDVVDHIDHAVKVAGIDHVGIGSDFDGINVTPSGLEDVSKIGSVFDEMKKRGYSDSEIEKVAGKNFLRVLSEVQDVPERGL
ncbi:MAG: dipeptidase [Bacteroidales bacterium]|nr:dipeptidase [Bacteroidales bacterium]